jgi:alcohol dehydrogenase class IV
MSSFSRDPAAGPEDAAAWALRLCAELKVPPLRCYGIGEQHRVVLVEKAAQASSMKGNPIALTSNELREILTSAI